MKDTVPNPSQAKGKKRIGWMVITALLAAYVSVLVITQSAARPPASTLPPGSSDSADADGSLALAQLWSRLNRPFQVWEEPPNLLPEHTNEVLVSVEPDATQYPPALSHALIDWVKAGNTLVLASSTPDAIVRGLRLTEHSVGGSVSEIRVLRRGTPSATWRNLQLTESVTLEGAGLRSALHTYVTPTGGVMGAEIPVGNGRVVVWTDAAAFENGGIGRAQNFQVVWGLLANKAILWDEFGHGAAAVGMFEQMFRAGRSASIWFLTVAALLYAVASLLRFGRPLPHAEDAAREGTEFMDAFARHLQNPRLRLYFADLLSGVIWHRLTHRLGLGAQRIGSGGVGQPEALPWTWLDHVVSRHAQPALRERYGAWRRIDRQEPRTKRGFGNFLRLSIQLLALLGQSEKDSRAK